MDSATLFSSLHAVMYCMLFTTIITMTSDEPAAVPAIFRKMWLRYRVYQETRRIRKAERSGEKFWEIDMTKFEP